MITLFEIYENNKEPQIGDYVLIEDDDFSVIYTYTNKDYKNYWNWKQVEPYGSTVTWDTVTEFIEYLTTQIGKIVGEGNENSKVILYDYLPKKCQVMFPMKFEEKLPKILFSNDSIKLFSKSKDDIQMVLQTKKYNL